MHEKGGEVFYIQDSTNITYIYFENLKNIVYFQAMLVSRDGEYMMTGGDKGIVEVRVITRCHNSLNKYLL